MTIASAIRDWIRDKAKVAVFRLLVFIAITSLAISEIPMLRAWALPTQVVAMITLGLILLLMEVVVDSLAAIDATQAQIVAANSEGVLYKWNDAVPFIRREVEHGHSIVILANSGEMAYHALRDILVEKGDRVKTEVFMVSTNHGREDEDRYQEIWKSNWESLGSCVTGIHAFRSSTAFRLGAVIIDNEIGYLGHIGDPSARKHDAPSIRVTRRTQTGQFLMDQYRQWIDAHHIKDVAAQLA
jgi:hypothetical protein